MLRESAEHTGRAVDLRAVVDPSVDPRLGGGRGLLDLASAVVARDPVAAAPARDRVRAELGDAALVDAAGVIGNFEMMNRIADATGMPMGRAARAMSADLITGLGFDRFDHTG